jgi:hypothetical protein
MSACGKGGHDLDIAKYPHVLKRLIYINGMSRGRSSFFAETGEAMKMLSVLA